MHEELYRPIHDDFLNNETGCSMPNKSAFANNIAIIGNAWGKCPHADYNRQFFNKSGNEYAEADEMFKLAESHVKGIR